MADNDSPFRPYHLWFSLLLLLICVGYTISGCLDLWRTRQLVRDGIHAQAVVADYRVNPPDKHSGTTYRPVLRLVDPAGKAWENRDTEAQNKRSPAVGQTVEVIYPPGHPGDFKLNNQDLWTGSIIQVVGGVIVCPLILGMVVFVRLCLERPEIGAKAAWTDRYLLPVRIVLWLVGR